MSNTIKAIVSVYNDWGIGANGTQPIVLKADRQFFRNITLGNTVIVGRKTLEDFPGGKPLKDRANIVLTRQEHGVPGAVTAHTVEEALRMARQHKHTYVIGGASVYKAMLPHIDQVLVTKIRVTPHSDAFFPNLDDDPNWSCTYIEDEAEENGIAYQFMTYIRN